MKNPAHYLVLLTLALLALLFVAGCTNNDDCIYVDRTPPSVPRGLFTVTGDERVDLYWIDNSETDLEGYRIYWNDEATGVYTYMATTANPYYADFDVVNGTTYYYAVTAFDKAGNESDLSYETISDTPRPAGTDLVLYDCLGPSAALSGYDFSMFSRQYWNDETTDIFYGYVDGLHIMYAWNPYSYWPTTDIQDAGYRMLDEADDAPPDGWTDDYLVILTEGHTYFVWTRDNHYAKFYVKAIGSGFVVVDWAYQLQEDNPELVPKTVSFTDGALVPNPAQLSKIGG